MEKYLKWGKSVFSCIPGLAVMIWNLGLPPNVSKVFWGAVIEACGILTLLIFNLNAPKFKSIDDNRIQRNAIVYFVLFLILLVNYLIMCDLYIRFSDRYNEVLLVPFKLNDELTYMIKKAGSVNQAINEYGIQALKDAINDSPANIAITKIVFAINYLLIFEMLTLGFAWSAAKVKK